MSGIQNQETRPDGGRRAARLGLRLAALAAILYGASACGVQSGKGVDLKSLATGEMAKLDVTASPAPAPQLTAQGPDGGTVSLDGLKGQVVVVNLWASWCAPCKTEMPTLARLQAQYAGKPVKVVAISLDKGDADIAKARAFIADKPPLGFYHGDYALAFSLNPPVPGLPTTILYDRAGRERARLSGGADWSTPAAHKVIDALLAQSG